MPPGSDTALNGDMLTSRHRSEPEEDAPPAEEEDAEEEEEDEEPEREEERRREESDSDTVDWGAGGGDESWPWLSAAASADQSHQTSPRTSPHPLPHALSTSPHASPTGDVGDLPTPDTGRRNKRKNFQPRAIVYQYAEAASEANGEASETRDSFSGSDEQALDLTESRGPPPSASDPAPMDLTVRTPTQINSALPGRPPASVDPSEMKRYAENTWRELLGIYGFPQDQNEAHQSPAGEFCGCSVASKRKLQISVSCCAQILDPIHTLPTLT